ncbi:cytidine deaminase-like protein [Dipodascopsis tothii]|uniref:cytidine deaminase-like protein n=1 Tax=Dipodascopsis tothii TaxID=44089 RepID=UPI0034CFF3A4
MLILICGARYTGKSEIARYLGLQGFKQLAVRSADPANDSLDSLDSSALTPAGSSPNTSVSRSADHSHDSSIDAYEQTVFASTTELIDYVTTRWNQRFVTTDVDTVGRFEEVRHRSFVYLLSVEAPLGARYRRHVAGAGKDAMTLEQFVEQSDTQLYGPGALVRLTNRSKVHIVNAAESLELLYLKLSDLRLWDDGYLRPSWDEYFMHLASLASRRSNCMKRRVGCVLVRGRRVIATGYNGTPRGIANCNEGGCPRCNSGAARGTDLFTCLCMHAEENALLEAGRERVGSDAILYCDTCPCLTCCVKIVQIGIVEVVYAQEYSMDTMSSTVFKEAGVVLRQYSHRDMRVVV